MIFNPEVKGQSSLSSLVNTWRCLGYSCSRLNELIRSGALYHQAWRRL